MRKAFAQALKRAKLPGFRLYDLRHTFASLLLAQNAPITYVSNVRERAARAHGRDDDAPVVRAMATAHGQARGGHAGRRLGQRGRPSW